MRIVAHGPAVISQERAEALLECGENVIGVYCTPPAQGEDGWVR